MEGCRHATGAGIQEDNSHKELSAFWAAKCFEELNETKEIRESRIAELRSMNNLITADRNLRVRTDDAFLLRFLRAKKFETVKSFHMLQRYFLMKLHNPELFRVPRPSEKSHVIELQAQVMLGERDQFGRRVYVFRVDRCDPSLITSEDIFLTNVLAMEHLVREPETQISGVTVLVDMSGFSVNHAKFMSPYYARKTVEVVQDTFPLRFKGFHVINEPFYFDAIMAVLKPFLKDKMRRRIFLHGNDMNSLHAFISPDILPKEYGGHAPPLDNRSWHLKLLAEENYFIELEQYGYICDNVTTSSDKNNKS